MPTKTKTGTNAHGENLCGLCDKTLNESLLKCGKPLIKTKCCKHWICNDSHLYSPGSFGRNSCFINHQRYTLCGLHHAKNHEHRWQDCLECKNDMDYIHYAEKATNGYNFEILRIKREKFVCDNCGFGSFEIKDFCGQLTNDIQVKFYCREEKFVSKGFSEGYPGTNDSFVCKNLNTFINLH